MFTIQGVFQRKLQHATCYPKFKKTTFEEILKWHSHLLDT